MYILSQFEKLNDSSIHAAPILIPDFLEIMALPWDFCFSLRIQELSSDLGSKLTFNTNIGLDSLDTEAKAGILLQVSETCFW